MSAQTQLCYVHCHINQIMQLVDYIIKTNQIVRCSWKRKSQNLSETTSEVKRHMMSNREIGSCCTDWLSAASVNVASSLNTNKNKTVFISFTCKARLHDLKYCCNLRVHSGDNKNASKVTAEENLHNRRVICDIIYIMVMGHSSVM